MKKNNSLILKILLVCVALSLILVAVLMFTKNDKEPIIKNSENGFKIEVEKQLTPEELISNYKSSVLNTLVSFNGNYQETRNKLVEISGVPTDFRNLHFDLVVAFDYLIVNENKNTAKQRFEKIYEDYDWIKQPLKNIIESIK